MITRWLLAVVSAAAVGAVTLASAAEEPQFSRFLPLAEGNTWTYAKTVPKNSRDVGLIKEVQKDGDGNVAYTLELTKYHLK